MFFYLRGRAQPVLLETLAHVVPLVAWGQLDPKVAEVHKDGQEQLEI